MIKDITLCKDCIHKPYKEKYFVTIEDNGFIIERKEETRIVAPIQSMCPCIAGDDCYSWIPTDDWYCGNGEPK